MRATNAPASRKRRIRTIKAAKGFRMRRSKLYRYAADALDHGRQYAYRDRKTKKRNYRALWQIRINAAALRGVGGDPFRLRDGGINGAAYVVNTTGAASFTDLLIGYGDRLDALYGK